MTPGRPRGSTSSSRRRADPVRLAVGADEQVGERDAGAEVEQPGEADDRAALLGHHQPADVEEVPEPRHGAGVAAGSGRPTISVAYQTS